VCSTVVWYHYGGTTIPYHMYHIAVIHIRQSNHSLLNLHL
jgi:hypothetical protein